MTTSIPKRIIQTDRTMELSPLASAATVNVKLLNPDFEYCFFDNAQVETFIDTRWPQYRPVFDAFRVPIQRYDFFRYLAIYTFGGFYLDVDVILSRSLVELLDHSCVFPFERLTWSEYLRQECGMHWEIGNYAFGATPGHPFLQAIIENCIRAQSDSHWMEKTTRSLPRLLQSDLYVIYSSGPGLVSRSLAEYATTAEGIHVLFPPDMCDRRYWNLVGSYGVHLMQSSWRTRQGFRTRLINLLSRRVEARALKLAKPLAARPMLHGRPYLD